MAKKSADETQERIFELSNLMPTEAQVRLKIAYIPNSILTQTASRELITNLSRYLRWQPSFSDDDPIKEIDIIEPQKEHSENFGRIRNALNMYLLRNKGGVADFHLVKDVVERHTDSLEQEIQMTQSTPLYLGLMGTMLGVIIGLGLFVFNINFSTPSVSADLNAASDGLSTLTGGINELLIGICIGMSASVYGLWLTVQNTTEKFKLAKMEIEKRKNDFYTFIQTELLPVLSQNVASSLHALQLNMTHFNNDFSSNILLLKDLMSKNYDALKNQSNILDKLEDLDISTFAKANVTIFAELKQSMGQLERFTTYLHQINSFVSKADDLNNRVNELLERTDNFEVIALNVSDTIETNKELSRFLNSHFADLQQRGQLISDAVIKVDDVIARSLEALKSNVNDNVAGMTRFSYDERMRLESAMKENRTSLSNLQYLAELSKTLTEFHKSNQKFTETFNSRLDRIDAQLEQAAAPNALERGFSSVTNWILPKKR